MAKLQDVLAALEKTLTPQLWKGTLASTRQIADLLAPLVEQDDRLTQAAVSVLRVDPKQPSKYHKMPVRQLWAEIHAREELDRLISTDETTWTELLRTARTATKRQKPGPIPDSEEELARLVVDFIATDWSQDVYCGQKLVSRYKLQKALAWARENPDYFQAISGIGSAMITIISERLRWR